MPVVLAMALNSRKNKRFIDFVYVETFSEYSLKFFISLCLLQAASHNSRKHYNLNDHYGLL